MSVIFPSVNYDIVFISKHGEPQAQSADMNAAGPRGPTALEKPVMGSYQLMTMVTARRFCAQLLSSEPKASGRSLP